MTEVLSELVSICRTAGDIDLYLFGSALSSAEPNDIDVLVVYRSLATLNRFKDLTDELELSPLLHIVAMTTDEEKQYDFVRTTGAVPLYRRDGHAEPLQFAGAVLQVRTRHETRSVRPECLP
jgi:predicted nucleotidyltransferase